MAQMPLLIASVPLVLPLMVGYIVAPGNQIKTPVFRFYLGVFEICRRAGLEDFWIGERAKEKALLIMNDEVEYFFTGESDTFYSNLSKVLELDVMHRFNRSYSRYPRYRLTVSRFGSDTVDYYLDRIRNGIEIDVEKENWRNEKRFQAELRHEDIALIPELSGNLR